MSNMNRVILMGNLGRDPELRHTAKGNPVVNLSLATTRWRKTEAGESIPETEWHRAIVWGKRAESCAEHLSKGSRVFLEGTIQTRSWEDREGKQRRTSEILVDRIQFMGASNRAGNSGISESAPALTQ
ncbi:MAG: single-stranded DNA-binding protein [Bdellovibrionales bacterium]|nr:single-stranded DNA-binding protein [Bdellovibrionales bacterium]